MDLTTLFAEHLDMLQQRFERILEKNHLAGLVISAGSPMLYYADDRYAPFQPTPHFAYWCPAQGPHHVAVIRPGKKPQVFLFAENDYWHAPPQAPESFWADQMQVEPCSEKTQLWKDLPAWRGFAYMGPEGELPASHGLVVNPPQLLAHADWARGPKTPYEIHCLSEANRHAAKAHLAVREAFAAGASELDLHHLFVASLACVEEDLPYHTIIGIDAHSSILHYQYKSNRTGGSVLLIDAGARFHHYGADITRTYAKARAPQTFRDLLAGMEVLQQTICSKVRSGVNFADLHEATHLLLAQLLLDHKILKGCSGDEAIDRAFTSTFLPHGLGHMLGIQVHDVSGKQANEDGTPCTPSSRFPSLRTLRQLREHDVITIEPGLYFIPMLIDKIKHGEQAKYFNLPLIADMVAYGGIRIEDDVVVGKEAARNLTRQFLPNHVFL